NKSCLKGKKITMSGMTIQKRIVTGVLAGMAVLATFLAVPQKAHASYSMPMPPSQWMKYEDAGGGGYISFTTGAHLQHPDMLFTDVAIYHQGQWMYGYGERIRKHDAVNYYDDAIDYVQFTLIDSYGYKILMEGNIYYSWSGDLFAYGVYGIAGSN